MTNKIVSNTISSQYLLMEELIKKVDAARMGWSNKYPHSNITPWDYFHLGIDRYVDGSCLFSFNPSHQKHLNIDGRIGIKDIKNWLNGKVVEGGIIRSQEAWDELVWLCKMGGTAYNIGYNIEYFNMYEPEYLIAPGREFNSSKGLVIGRGFPKQLQLPYSPSSVFRKMTPELIEVVEKHIKYIIKASITEQILYGNTNIYEMEISNNTDEEIYGFLYALRMLGLETCLGYGNAPAERENFAWWQNILKMEAKWEYWIEKGIAYEPWVKNRKSTYSYKS